MTGSGPSSSDTTHSSLGGLRAMSSRRGSSTTLRSLADGSRTFAFAVRASAPARRISVPSRLKTIAELASSTVTLYSPGSMSVGPRIAAAR